MSTLSSYMNCPRCGLSIQLRSGRTVIRHCPRCIARHRLLVELFGSPLSTETPYEEDRVPGALPFPSKRPNL